MSKLLVELMGGEIGVESTFGVGSTFWFELGLGVAPELPADTTGSRAQGVDLDPAAAGARTLLYVEDNVANLKLVEQLLARRSNLRLLTASDGNLGVEIARREQPDVILMDINLPGINGIQALKLLQDLPLTRHIPVLAISANAMLGDVRKGLDAGFFEYLTKPINVREFMEAIDSALDVAEKRSQQSKGEPAR